VDGPGEKTICIIDDGAPLPFVPLGKVTRPGRKGNNVDELRDIERSDQHYPKVVCRVAKKTNSSKQVPSIMRTGDC
jgi:hypothetical protein